MSQKFSLYNDLTVGENIDFFSGIYGVPRQIRGERKQYALRMSGLEEREHTMTGLLPGGMKQRLALGCAILHQPPMLFLDEPTSGVDPIARRDFWELIYQLSAAGQTVFVTTHYMDEAEYCHRLALMHAGKIIAMGVPSALKKELHTQSLLQLDSANPLESMKAIEHEPGIRDVAVFGAGLHVTVEDVAAATTRIRQALESRGIEIRRLEPISPSMEDVFVALVEAQEGAREKTAMNLRRTRAIARKELKHIVRDPRSLFMALAQPLLLLLLFGYALNLDVDRIPTLVYDANRSAKSRELIQRFQGSRFFEIRGFVDDHKAIERAIDRGRALMGIVIPQDYSERIEATEKAEVQILIDGSDSNTASIALGYVSSLIRNYSFELRSQVHNRRAGWKLDIPVDARLRVWYNSTLESKNYVVPGLIAVILMIIAALLTSLTIAREWEMGTMEQLLSTPLRPPEIVLGKMLAFFVRRPDGCAHRDSGGDLHFRSAVPRRCLCCWGRPPVSFCSGRCAGESCFPLSPSRSYWPIKWGSSARFCLRSYCRDSCGPLKTCLP